MSKLIRISDLTYQKLVSKGSLADTFDSVITELIEQCNHLRVQEASG